MLPPPSPLSSPTFRLTLGSPSLAPTPARLASPACGVMMDACPGAPRVPTARRFRSPPSARSLRRSTAVAAAIAEPPYSPSHRNRTPRSPRKLRRSPALTTLAVFTSLAFSEADSSDFHSEMSASGSSSQQLGEALKVEGDGIRRTGSLIESPSLFEDWTEYEDDAGRWSHFGADEESMMSSSPNNLMTNVDGHGMSSQAGFGLGINMNSASLDMFTGSIAHPSSMDLSESGSDYMWQEPPPPYASH